MRGYSLAPSQRKELGISVKTLGVKISSIYSDGFGRSDTREALREFFEVDARFITVATLGALARDGTVSPEVVAQAIGDLGIDPEKADPAVS